MAEKIALETGKIRFEGTLNDSPGAVRLLEQLPLTLSLSRWGDEYYGNCGFPVESDASAREIMEVGELALWPPGRALCLFFGPTPASTDDRPKAASPVVPVGRVSGDFSQLRGLGSTIQVTVSKIAS
jgi:hypothetical protein